MSKSDTSDVDFKGGGGIGFLGLLTVLFIGLKLTGYIAWSWWLVLAPLWVPFVLIITIAALMVLVMSIQK